MGPDPSRRGLREPGGPFQDIGNRHVRGRGAHHGAQEWEMDQGRVRKELDLSGQPNTSGRVLWPYVFVHLHLKLQDSVCVFYQTTLAHSMDIRGTTKPLQTWCSSWHTEKRPACPDLFCLHRGDVFDVFQSRTSPTSDPLPPESLCVTVFRPLSSRRSSVHPRRPRLLRRSKTHRYFGKIVCQTMQERPMR